MRLATTPLCHLIAISKLTNITINCLTHPWPNVLADKWRFNTNQDWEVLEENFDSVSSDTILNGIFQALGFHLSPLVYLEEGLPRFVNVTEEPKLAIEPKDNDRPITDSKDEKARKELEHIAKRKPRRDNLHTFVQAPAPGSTALLSSDPGSPTQLSSRLLVPTLLLSHLFLPGLSSFPVPGLSSHPIPGLLFRPLPGWLSCLVPGL